MRRPDRKDLLAYLKGDSSSTASIDKSAPLEMPTQVPSLMHCTKAIKRRMPHGFKVLVNVVLFAEQVKRAADSDLSEAASKKPRYDDVAREKLKDQLAMKYGAVAAGEAGAAPGTAVSDLSDELNKNKIMEIKKKIMANRRTRIKGDGEEGDRGLASFADIESDRCVILEKFRVLCTIGLMQFSTLHVQD